VKSNTKAILLSGGTTDGVKLDAKITSANYSISMWVKPTALTNQYSAVFYAGESAASALTWFSNYDGDGKTFLIRSAGDGWSKRVETGEIENVLKVGEWSMVTLAMSGNTGTLYVNGQSLWTGDLKESFFVKHPNSNLCVGVCGYDNTFDGAFDEVNIYDGITLTQTAVTALYNAEKAEE
jgi:arabinan endo-1,5-alpha-L-arabinosidase